MLQSNMQFNATQGPSTLPRLMTPGSLDRGQNKRVRRHLDSKLSFATYDYYTARSDNFPDIEQLSLKEELYRSSRVVIETLPSGVSTWRFVPRATKAEGVPDEGPWPRPVEICGNFYECSQDSWDVYKLDPLYHCFVRAPPMCPLISRRTDQKPGCPVLSPKQASNHLRPPPSTPLRKKTVYFETESEDEHNEVEDMVVDDENLRAKPAGPSPDAKLHRRKVDADRSKRRAKTALRTGRLSRDNNSLEPVEPSCGASPTSRAKSAPARPAAKRKANLFDSLRTNRDFDDAMLSSMDEMPLRNTANYTTLKKKKRTRTTSPGEIRKILKEKKAARREPRMEQRKQDLRAWRMAREQERLRDIYIIPSDVDMPDAGGSQSNVEMNSPSPERQSEADSDNREKTPVPDDIAHDTQAAHEAAIEASRRKMAELEKDRHLWEEAALRRREREMLEEEARKREAAARRDVMEAENREKTQRMEEEQKRREESAQPQTPTAQKIFEEQQRQEKVLGWHQTWGMEVIWTDEHAIHRFFTLMKAFVETTFKPGAACMSALDIPWPMLRQNFTLDDVTSEAVADFFNALRLKMAADAFRSFVKKSSLRFHPDHWTNRLNSVANQADRQAIFEGVCFFDDNIYDRAALTSPQPKPELSNT